MKRISKIAVSLLVLLALTLQLGPVSLAANDIITTTPTGYTSAEDVQYIVINGTVVNWGARGEDCVFLTTYAQSYYTGSYSWETLSAKDGGTGTSDAYSSQLYIALQNMMQANHTNIQGYQDTRPYYKYTDCVGNDHSLISSFYSGKTVNSTWDGKTYNREHVWPNSKCLNTGKKEDSADIMMLRATISSENGARGNKAYGESGGFHDPGVSVRGDCARMFLYGYVRWGNVNGNSDFNTVWGTEGVMESLDVLLRWMEEDPVDTWEMARNDAVQSITGVRNVFVDYPEYAWMIFGREVPEGMVTPSGNAADISCSHSNTQLRDQKDATCGKSGYTGDTYCADCGEKLAKGKKISATGKHSYGDWVVTEEPTEEKTGKQVRACTVCGNQETGEIPKLDAPVCDHVNKELRDAVEATCGADGYSGDSYCTDCGLLLNSGSVVFATGDHAYGEWTVIRQANGSQTGERTRQCSQCDYTQTEEIPMCSHADTQTRDAKEATCATAGYTGDTYCAVCGDLVEKGSAVRATGKHSYSDWVEQDASRSRSCTVCDHSETVQIAQTEDSNGWIWIVIAVAAATAVTVVVILVAKKKKK